VIIALHERGIQATRLRVDQPSLDDAFIALTHRDEPAADPWPRGGPDLEPDPTAGASR
jgi:ABC-2 type transport system ATP-binding protein